MHSKCVDDASLFYFNYKVVISSHHDSSQCVCSFLPTFNSSHVQHILDIVACLPIPCMQVSLTYYSHSQRSCPAAKYHKNNFPRIQLWSCWYFHLHGEQHDHVDQGDHGDHGDHAKKLLTRGAGGQKIQNSGDGRPNKIKVDTRKKFF